MKPHQLFTGHLRFLEETLAKSLRDLKKSDPLAEVWVIVPNQLARLHLQRFLAGKLQIAANIRFKTVTDLMHALAEPVVLEEGWSTLSEAAVDPLLENVLSAEYGKLKYLKPVANSAGFRRALLKTRRDLILHEIAPADLNRVLFADREREYKLHDLALLYSAVNQALEKLKLHDSAMLQQLAYRAARTNINLRAPLNLYCVFELPPLTRSILGKVMSNLDVTAFLPWVADRRAYEYNKDTYQWYMSSGFTESREENAAVQYTDIRFVSTPRESAAATEIIRDIIDDESIKSGSAAVLLAGSGALSAVLETRCQMIGLHPYIYEAKTVGQTAAGRGLSALVELLDGELSRERVADYLASAPFISSVASLTGEWIRLAEESYVIAGLKDWEYRISRKIEQLEYHASKFAGQDEEEDSVVDVRRRIENANACLAFMRELDAMIQRAASAASWESGVAAVWEYYKESIELDEEFAGLTHQLEQASLLDAARVPCTAHGLREFLLSALETPGTRTGKFNAGTPIVAPREVALGATFPHVFLPGFNEGTVPHLQKQDPLLLDADRYQLNTTLSASLPLAKDSLVRERFLLEMQLRSATESVTICYSQSDADGRPLLKSPYIAELCEIQNSVPLTAEELDSLLKTLPNRQTLSNPLRVSRSATPVSRSEYNRRKLFDALQDGNTHALSHLAQDSEFQRIVNSEVSRFSARAYTNSDGLISNSTALAHLNTTFSRDIAISASTLEDYWKCPFRFLVTRLWEAYAPESVNKLSPLTEREKGTLLHNILQRYHGRKLNLPVTGEHYTWDELRSIALEEITSYARKFPMGSRFAAAKLRQQILLLLQSYYADLFNSDTVWLTRHVELSFGFGKPPMPAAVPCTFPDEEQILFKGRIDRWDSDAAGREINIIDYKSGSPPKKNSRKMERRLQREIYRLAAESAAPAANVSAQYYYIAGALRDVASDAESRAEALSVAASLLSDLRTGIFAPDPAEDDSTACKYCSVKLACGAQRHSGKAFNSSAVPNLRTNRTAKDDTEETGADDNE